MNLVEESFQNKEQKKKKKITTIILILIAVVFIAIIAIIVYISQVKNSALKIYLDGNQNSKIENTLIIENDGTIYAKVKEIAGFLGYESYNGEYAEKSEEVNKCYVESKEEICNFELGSKKLYKLDLTSSRENYEYCYIKNPIKSINGEICADTEAIEKAFNVSFNYDKDKNSITIYTIPYLKDKVYLPKILDAGYKEISDVLSNKKAILENMIVVKKDNNTMAVINTSGEAILESKYTNITYLPNIGDFLVETNKKVGVLSKDKTTIISPRFDSVELMDMDSELYLVKQENKYGVVDFRGEIKIFIENDEIGIDINKFSKNDLKSKYILAGNLIPVKKNNKWGLFNKKGTKIIDFKYDSFGYIASSNKNALNLLVIPGYNAIVACKNKKYTLLDSNGEELFAPVADDIYMTIEGNEKQYFINANDNPRDATKFLESRGITSKGSNNNEKDDNKVEKNNNSTSSQNPNKGENTENQIENVNNNEEQQEQNEDNNQEEQNNE